jgi:hypothetical protein
MDTAAAVVAARHCRHHHRHRRGTGFQILILTDVVDAM